MRFDLKTFSESSFKIGTQVVLFREKIYSITNPVNIINQEPSLLPFSYV